MQFSGDIEQRYTEFLTQFGGNIKRFCLYYSNNRDDADDLMQEIFAALWTALPGLNAGISSRGANRWLHRLMFSVWTKHLRHRRPPSIVPLGLLDGLDIRDHDGESQSALEELLDELSSYLPHDDRLLVQDIRHGYTMPEIADRHSTGVGAIYTRISRIKEKLKKINDKIYGTHR